MSRRSRLRLRLRDVAASALDLSSVTRPSRRARNKLTIATFHRVLPSEQLAQYPLPVLAVTPEELRWFLAFFARHFECGTLQNAVSKLRQRPSSARPLLAITFDDGQLDNYLHARPVLEGLGLRATFFVPLDAVEGGGALWHDRLAYVAQRLLEDDPRGGAAQLRKFQLDATDPGRAVRSAKRLSPSEREVLIAELEAAAGGAASPPWDGFMSWEQLRELSDAGHEIGSHSMSHALLTQCDEAALAHEVQTSRDILRDRLNATVDSFCYPNGDANAQVVAAVKRAGYTQAVTTGWGLNGALAEPLALRRCDMAGRHARDRHGRLSTSRLKWRISGLYPGLE